ncbi:protein of unknown function [Taphrina deformans PYCC 5710]|uniref:Uncharacterized protein n=1 Tax=Taphrina deformans (strain PYCC 5710 / ATCC 11124 / CBS 356.35 / IMI 108563 / JCM 9778 / NBRC 8474) TaxID=1097556 RepID=R4XMB4_TAPDE|nr:protein of unknown function [Taphrina deformans PYCC 5710]|eukprot:CCG84440.1 protein of unknown function [Taphrina deformans PYCC 5710]
MNAPQNIRDIAKHYKTKDPASIDSDSGYEEGDSVGATDPFHGLYGVRMHWYFAIMSALCLVLYDWSARWALSGAPLLCFVLLSGRLGWLSKSPKLLLWTLFNVNAAYALLSTSWLFYDFYVVTSYPTIFVLAILSSKRLQKLVRKTLGFLLSGFNFNEDKLAFFDLPAIDIDDGDVPCLLVIRGFTFSLSTMTFVVHGVEVGVKLNDDIELAIQTDRFTWRLFREISIGDVYGSVKSSFQPDNRPHQDNYQDNRKAEEDMTDGRRPKTTRDLSQIEAQGDIDQVAKERYESRLRHIQETNTVVKARGEIGSRITDDNKIKAAIGATIFPDTSVPNPPRQQIKSSYLNSLIPGWIMAIIKGVPVLLRLFLNPMSYNHPVHFDSIVLTGSGEYINKVLDTQFFKYYPDVNKEIRKLHGEVKEFLANGNFSLILPNILGLASVPMLTQYDIVTFVKAPRVLLLRSNRDESRAEPDVLSVDEVAEITGLASTFTIPSYLLPNHEHLIPPPPEDASEDDVAAVKMSIIGSLPGKFHPDMVDFAINVVKASQVLSLHKQANSMSTEVHSAADFGRSVGKATKEQTKKKLVEAHVDDAWLHKLIIKGFGALRTARGDAGYQMDLPVPLRDLRTTTYVGRAPLRATPKTSRRSSLMSACSTGSEVHGTA